MSDELLRIIYPKEDGGVAIVVPVSNTEISIEELAKKVVPDGLPYQIVSASEIPDDRTFRDAWTYEE